MDEEMETEKSWRPRRRVGKDEVRVAAVGLPEGRVGVQGRGTERGVESAGGALRRSGSR
jgi:hypothetical protein